MLDVNELKKYNPPKGRSVTDQVAKPSLNGVESYGSPQGRDKQYLRKLSSQLPIAYHIPGYSDLKLQQSFIMLLNLR